MNNKGKCAAAAKAREQKKAAVRHAEERKHILTEHSDFFIREAYKTLRTNITFALTDEETSKVIVITSALQSEGKSTTALNLAISYAMTESKVIIIDCDLRRSKLGRLTGKTNKVGLSNLLVYPDLRKDAIIPSDVENLDLLLAGDIPPNPSELLGSSRMKRLIADLKETYDYIILDAPPVNLFTDAVVLAPQSDGVLFLVRANRSERGAVIHGVEQLEYSGAKLLGFVLNGVETGVTRYGYGKYRYKGYRKYSYYGRGGYGSGYGYGYGYSMKPYEYAQQEQDSVKQK